MNIYDTTNMLVQEIKHSEEYVNFKMARQTLLLNRELSNKIKEFEKKRYEVQLLAMQTGKNDQEGLKVVQNMYADLIENDDAKRYFEAETKFNIMIADINKIIGESIKEVME